MEYLTIKELILASKGNLVCESKDCDKVNKRQCILCIAFYKDSCKI